MRALVTGGCGFIGSAVVNKLVQSGDVVDIVDDLSNGNPSNLDYEFNTVPPTLLLRYPKKAEINKPLLITGDFADIEILSKVRQGEYEVVYHLAANPRVAYSVEKPVESNETNLHKSVALFKVAADSNTRVVFSSSSAVYGDVESLPTRETVQGIPQSPYALQKLLCEQYLDLFNRLYGLDSISLRYFNVYGPKALGSSPYATAIAAWCNALHDGNPLRSDGDGNQTRDMVYIEDIAESNYLAGRFSGVLNSEKVNIATCKAYSNNFILNLIKEHLGDLSINNAPEREGDVKHTLGSTSRAHDLLNFQTKVGLEEGLKKTLAWWGLLNA
jgi:UDP-glucose 4-epimerase